MAAQQVARRLARGARDSLLVAAVVVGTGITLFELGLVDATPVTERALVVMAAVSGVAVGGTTDRRAAERLRRLED